MHKKISFGLNRLDFRSPDSFASDVRRLERLGWDYAFIPSSPLLMKDPYVMLAEGLRRSEQLTLGTLIENPVMRDPAVIAGSIATVDSIDPGRTLLGLGIGDTAVRLMGRRPATVLELENATKTITSLLSGESVEVNAARSAKLRHSPSKSEDRPPVWIAAQGPKTLRMAGRVADGVFIRVGTHPANLKHAIKQVHQGASEVGRDKEDVEIAAIFHTILEENADHALSIARATAAGYYEHTASLFETANLDWNGPRVDELRMKVWPDFHHAADMKSAGKLVSFLSEESASAFSLRGSASQISEQLSRIIEQEPSIGLVIPHPMPTPGSEGLITYTETLAKEVIPYFK